MIVVKGEYITRIVHLAAKVIIEKMVPTVNVDLLTF